MSLPVGCKRVSRCSLFYAVEISAIICVVRNPFLFRKSVLCAAPVHKQDPSLCLVGGEKRCTGITACQRV